MRDEDQEVQVDQVKSQQVRGVLVNDCMAKQGQGTIVGRGEGRGEGYEETGAQNQFVGKT